MSRFSRRALIAAAVVAPLANGGADAPVPASPRRVDAVVSKVRDWMTAYDARDAMISEWQDWENALCDRIRPLGMNLSQGGRSGFPEARAMRALDRKIKAATRKLDREAARIVVMRASSAEGALAKIQMGMRLQGPYDWEEFAYALIQDGCEQMRQRLNS